MRSAVSSIATEMVAVHSFSAGATPGTVDWWGKHMGWDKNIDNGILSAAEKHEFKIALLDERAKPQTTVNYVVDIGVIEWIVGFSRSHYSTPLGSFFSITRPGKNTHSAAPIAASNQLVTVPANQAANGTMQSAA